MSHQTQVTHLAVDASLSQSFLECEIHHSMPAVQSSLEITTKIDQQVNN